MKSSRVRSLDQGALLDFIHISYKLYNSEQADTAQSSGLGVTIFDNGISCISLADDVVLLSNDLYSLRLLLHLTSSYCEKYDVQLVSEKTNLLAFYHTQDESVDYEKHAVQKYLTVKRPLISVF